MESSIKREEVINALKDTGRRYTSLLSSLNEKQLNTVPFEGSWTAGQVVRHIILANDSSILLKECKIADRDISERVPELKNLFLDFSIKMESPDFILPEKRNYDRKRLLERIGDTFEKLDTHARVADLSHLIEELPLGPITKWELINFMLFHSQRHVYQLENIRKKLLNE